MVPKVPVKVALGLVFNEKLPPAPLIIVQVPVPTVGVLPASVADVTPQRLVWSGPAAAVVGLLLNVIVTSSVLAVQGAFAIVHLST